MGKLQDFVDNVNNFAKAVGDDIKSLKIRQENFINDQQSASDSTYSSEMINNRLGDKVDKQPGKDLSDQNFTQAEKQKLAGLEGSKFKGVHPSLTALQSNFPPTTVEAGSYADVDTAGADVVRYIIDKTDNKWVPQQSGTPLTASQVKNLYESNPDTNAFTDSYKIKLDNTEAGAQMNTVHSVAGKTGAVTLVKADVGLTNVQNYPVATLSQAQNATGNAYMTPGRTESYVDYEVGDENPLAIYNTAAGN